MTIERIQQALRLDTGNRFIILYGGGLDDTFITVDFDAINIEAALFDALQNAGFERIAYLSPHQPVYFLDDRSRELATPTGLYNSTSAPSGEMRILRDGPLANRYLLPVSTETIDPLPGGGMGDVHALRWLDTIMRDSSGPKSAVVLVQAESTLQYFEDPRTLAGLIGNWARLPASNANLCLLLFSAVTSAQLSDIAQNLAVPEIRSAILDNGLQHAAAACVNRIGAPQPVEIERLLHHMQQQRSMTLGEDASSLGAWLSTEGISVHQWMTRLTSIDYLDREVARRHGWIAAVSDPLSSAEDSLSNLVGLHRVKQHLSEMSAWLYLQMQRETDSGSPLLHMVFTGNPGTGKTTVARLIGEMYRNLGLLKRGHLVEARASDLVSAYVGGTTGRTDQVIDNALDGVLFIDEAYILTEPDRGGYGQEAVDTLLSRMENDRHRLVVIVAGYPEKMRHFLESNPGVARRFPIENHYDFPDFSPDELSQILQRLLADRSIPIEEGMQMCLSDIVHGLYRSRDETFGNAGEMRNLCDAIDRRRAVRILQQQAPFDSALEIEDVPDQYRNYLAPPIPDIDRLLENLDEMVGLQSVKSNLRRMAHRLELEQIRSQQSLGNAFVFPAQHLVFSGNPGTGKTTIARLVGRMYRSLGLLKKGHVVEVSRHDLVAGYVGQTAIKTMDRVKAALDGVLFVDEAYSLSGGRANDFGQEAIDTLVKAMEDFRGRLVVIAAGYPLEMQDFLNSNPGLRSRFSQPLPFPDYNSEEMSEILQRLALRDGFILTKDVIDSVLVHLNQIREMDGRSFGNARTVQAIFECMKDALAERVLSDKTAAYTADRLSTFLVDDVPLPAGRAPIPELRFEPLPVEIEYQPVQQSKRRARSN